MGYLIARPQMRHLRNVSHATCRTRRTRIGFCETATLATPPFRKERLRSVALSSHGSEYRPRHGCASPSAALAWRTHAPNEISTEIEHHATGAARSTAQHQTRENPRHIDEQQQHRHDEQREERGRNIGNTGVFREQKSRDHERPRDRRRARRSNTATELRNRCSARTKAPFSAARRASFAGLLPLLLPNPPPGCLRPHDPASDGPGKMAIDPADGPPSNRTPPEPRSVLSRRLRWGQLPSHFFPLRCRMWEIAENLLPRLHLGNPANERIFFNLATCVGRPAPSRAPSAPWSTKGLNDEHRRRSPRNRLRLVRSSEIPRR